MDDWTKKELSVSCAIDLIFCLHKNTLLNITHFGMANIKNQEKTLVMI